MLLFVALKIATTKNDQKSSQNMPVIYADIKLISSVQNLTACSTSIVCLCKGSYCNEFQCSNGKCIDDDLKCDRVDHCFDNSDEQKSTASCS